MMHKYFQAKHTNIFSKSCNAVLVFCLLPVFLLSSCTSEKLHETSGTDQGVSLSYVQGLFTLTLQTSKKELTIAEQLELVLKTEVSENVEVKFPDYSASLGDFTLKDTSAAPPRMTGSGNDVRVVHRVRYLLEPYLSGTYSIPAMAISFRDKNNGAGFTELMTEEIQVSVHSLVGSDATMAESKDISPPVSMPPDRALQLMVAGLLILLAALVAAGLLYWKKTAGKNEPAEVLLRPEEIALQQLEILLAEGLLDRGEIKPFHLRISDILRHYIENRFGLKAPERTTEEFLTELSMAKSSESALLGSHKVLLTDFLTQCDLVKFAKHEPTIAESEKTVVICRDFIEKTREKKVRREA